MSSAGCTIRHVCSTTSSRAKRRGEPGDRVVEQPLVRLAALAERGGEVDGDVDVLAVEVRPGRLGLQGERDAVVLAEPEAHQVACRRRPAGLVEQQARRLAELDDHLGGGSRQAPCRSGRTTARPAHRHESISRRAATNVSTVESGATPGSSR